MNQRKLGVILSYLAQFIQILVGLIYTPVMLRLLGQNEYGLYQLVYSTVSYLSLLSLGFGGAYLRFYSRYKTKDDENEIARLNGMFMLIFTSISIICILCGMVMLSNIEVIFGSGLTNSELSIAKVLMTLMIINLALTFPNSLFNSYITAHEKFIFQKALIVLQQLINPFLTLPLLLMGYGSIGMVSITTSLTILLLVSNIYFCFKKLNIKFSFKGLQFSLLKEMWVFTFFIFLNQIIDQVNWSVDKFLLGRIIGTAAVAVYGVGAQLNTMYLSFSLAISNVFAPRVNRIVAESDDNKELSRLFTKIGRIQAILMFLILSGFIIFGKAFIQFWAGEGYEAAYYVTLCLIVPVTVSTVQNLGLEIQRAKNKHKARSIVYFIIAIGNVTVSYFLISKFGPVGAAFGTTIALVLGNILFMNWYYHNRIGLDMIYFWKEIAKFIPALIIPCIVGVAINRVIIFNNLFSLGLWAIVYTAFYCGSMWFFGMNSEEKQMLSGPMNKVKGILFKRSINA